MKPFALKTALYKHQQRAFNKLSKLKVGALFMEMGTGKTRTAIELAKFRVGKIDKVIWCCPVSVKETIKQEILKHTDCSKDEIYVFDSKTTDINIPNAGWIAVGIESIGQSDRVTVALNNIITDQTMLVVDESSFIKGYRSKRAQRLTIIGERARYKLILTGTPLSHGIVDLYSQMKFLSPKILNYASFYSFATNHLVYDERFKNMVVGVLNEGYIARKINPYVYQVTKEECLSLPEKLYDTWYFEMDSSQRMDYEYEKQEFIENITQENINIGEVFTLFLHLQQIVSGFRNKVKYNSRREETMLNIIDTFDPDEKVIIWAKYKEDIRAITSALSGVGKFEIFTGETKQSKRQKIIDGFQNGDIRFLVSTPSAGGFGITLTAASKVIFYNNSFKYSERIQAEDRCHRIGQEKKVTYIDIICSDSIDGKIYRSLMDKEDVVEAFKKEVEKIKDKNEKDIRKSLGL
jgi:hypothetical protein